MIKIKYIYSACVGIETADATILCDPWFTEGAYDGSWYHYPRLENPLEVIGKYDFIYVSHIHPDHYDPVFLRSYLQKYPKTRIMIAPFTLPYLSKKMKQDGIIHEIIDEITIEKTQIKLFPNEVNSYDIDSALAVRLGDSSVVNMNDNLFNQAQIDRIKSFVGDPTIALMGYTGAGPYPQTYFDEPAVLLQEADEKKKSFFKRYLTMRNALNPQRVIPFAGKYILGGKLHGMNPYRGIADALEVSEFDPTAIVLADGGNAWIDTETLRPTAVRTEKYTADELRSYSEMISKNPMLYETYFNETITSALPLKRLLPKAYLNAVKRSIHEQNYYFCFKLDNNDWFICNAKKGSGECEFISDPAALEPRSEIYIDPRYLFGLLTCVFHWNNAEVGSQYQTRRYPNEFIRDIQAFLVFFHV